MIGSTEVSEISAPSELVHHPDFSFEKKTSVFSSAKEKRTTNEAVVQKWDIHCLDYLHSHCRYPHHDQNAKTTSNSFPNWKGMANGVSGGVPV